MKTKNLLLLVLTILTILSCGTGKKSNEIILKWVTDNNPMRLKQIRIFEKMNPGIKIELLLGLKAEQKLTQIASGKPAFSLMDVYSVSKFRELVNKNALIDLSGRFKKDKISLEILWPATKKLIMEKNKIYGFPCNAGSFVLFYNSELTEKIGINIPRRKRLTWNEFRKLSKKLTIKDNAKNFPDSFGALLPFTAQWFQSILLWQTSGNWFTKNKKKLAFNYEKYKEALKMFYNMRYTDNSVPTPGNMQSMIQQGNWGTGVNTFASGKIGFFISGKWGESLFRKYKKLKYDVTYLPYFKGEKPYNFFASHSTVIPKGAKHIEQAYKFIKYLSSREYNKTIAISGDALPAIMKFAKNVIFMKTPYFPDRKNKIYAKEMENSRVFEFPNNFHFSEFYSRIYKQNLEAYYDAKSLTIEQMINNSEKEGNKLFDY